MKLLRSSFFTALAALGIAALTPNMAHAQTMLYDINSGSGSSTFTNGGNWGFNFTTTSAINVGSLGFWDQGANGVSGSKQVGIFTSGGSLLVSTTITSADTVVPSAFGSGQWLFKDLATPFSLGAGTYTLGFFSDGTDSFLAGTTTTYMSGASYVQAKARAGAASFAWPDANSGIAAQGFYGANLRTAVPEPGTLALLALGGVGLLVRRRRGK